jgi:hypothetical protein
MGRPKRNGGPRINLRPPSLWFESNPHRVPWKPDMIAEEAARVRERFLDGTSDSIEWFDFAETRQRDRRAERYRTRCHELSPLVNRPDEMDEAAVVELRSIVGELRSATK